MISATSAAARVAGVVVAAGYLLGVVDGPVTGVIGGLALITFGRALVLDRVHEVRLAAALAVLAGGVGIAVLRWGTLDLPELHGVQAVLGPTLLVGPLRSAVACSAAALAGVVALGAWLTESTPETGTPIPEALVGSTVLTAVFWGPGPRGVHVGDVAVVVLAVGVTATAAIGLALGLRRSGEGLVTAAVVISALAVVGAAGLLA